ncbi:hypothetical protein LLG90_24535 [Aromatoleum toluclasticum]|uniref:hypothetical protein n=1 Tax=Aromatoleum toluclasticum TaxID=92003 RepID=UPI001D17E551|nr:hypothetical protein [Aromatoleum toluclasticum]MCC4118531.1 hypothetical protein [Aromatoleum toluclasticum]
MVGHSDVIQQNCRQKNELIMRDPYDSGNFFPILVILAAFVVAKVLAKLGIATKQNADTIAKVLAAIVGITYAATFEFVRSFGPIADFFLRIALGAMVGGVLWVFILMGVGGAVGDDEKAK